MLAATTGEPLVVGGDIILKIHGVPALNLPDHRRVRDLMATLRPGSPFAMTVLRLGPVMELHERHS